MEDATRLYSLEELLDDHLPIGRSLLFEEIKSGRLQTVKIGRRTLVTARALQTYIDLLEDQFSSCSCTARQRR